MSSGVNSNYKFLTFRVFQSSILFFIIILTSQSAARKLKEEAIMKAKEWTASFNKVESVSTGMKGG